MELLLKKIESKWTRSVQPILFEDQLYIQISRIRLEHIKQILIILLHNSDNLAKGYNTNERE